MMDRPLCLSFNKLSCRARSGLLQSNEFREILKSVSGEFLQMTGIVGPSGSGKSSLLNVLSGFSQSHVAGDVKINGEAVRFLSLMSRLINLINIQVIGR